MRPLVQRPARRRRPGLRALEELASQVLGLIHLEVGEADAEERCCRIVQFIQHDRNSRVEVSCHA